jgi:pyrimidine deaminase RibD-like protein
MLIHTKLPPGIIYPQLTQFPENYDDFLAAFRDGQTVDRNNLLTTADTLQTNMYKTALGNKHLETRGNPIPGESLVDIFLTEVGAERILVPMDRQFCEMAVELSRKSISENDGRLHPYVGAVVAKAGKVLATGYRGETGAGRHAEFCALKKLNDDVDNVDLAGCTVYTTLEPCSERRPPKVACATRLIKANAARVVSGMPDKDREVYGLSSMAEAKIHIGLFPSDLMQKLIALNKEWSDSRRNPDNSNVVRLPKLLDRIESCKQRYWNISKSQRIEWGLRPETPAHGYSGEVVIGLVEQLLLQALRGSYPFNTDDFSSIAWAQAQSLFGGSREFTSASEVVSVVEPMIAELEGKLSACEADQR